MREAIASRTSGEIHGLEGVGLQVDYLVRRTLDLAEAEVDGAELFFTKVSSSAAHCHVRLQAAVVTGRTSRPCVDRRTLHVGSFLGRWRDRLRR